MKFLKLFESIKPCVYKDWSKFFNKQSYKDEESFFKIFPEQNMIKK